MAKKATTTQELPALKQMRGTVLISPLDPRLVIDETMNKSRKGEPWDQPAIEEFAQNIAQYGQLQACKANEDSKGKIHIVWGFGRALAVKWLAETSLPKILLKVDVVKDMSEDVAADENVVENHYRKATNAADDAIEMKRRIDNGYSVEDVAKLFRVSPITVESYCRLTKLPKRHLDAMRAGLLSTTTAQDCLSHKDATERNRLLDTIVKEAANGGKALSVREARRVISRNVAQEDMGEDEGDDPNTQEEDTESPSKNGRLRGRLKKFPALLPDIRDMFQNFAASPVYPKQVNIFADTVMTYLSDRSDANEQKVEKALQELWTADATGVTNSNGEDVSRGWGA